MANTAKKAVKKTKKRLSSNQVEFHVLTSFNNTIVTATTTDGDTLAWSTAGACGFKGARKSTPYAAQIAAEGVGKVVKEMGATVAEVLVQGPGTAARESVMRVVGAMFDLRGLKDVTPIPHNGPRKKKKRRV